MKHKNKNHQTTNVRSLWRAVIMQAVVDATNKSRSKRALCHRTQAKKWLNERKDNTFIETCILAEMEPNYVQMKVDKFFKNQ